MSDGFCASSSISFNALLYSSDVLFNFFLCVCAALILGAYAGEHAVFHT